MTEVDDAKALLLNAVQDLFDAERALVERLAKDAGANITDEGLGRLISLYGEEADGRAQQLRRLARALGDKEAGAPNIWMRAVLDDAARDGETVAPGPLLDIALTGAIRKGAQAARVSYVTALKLAERLARKSEAGTLAELRDAHALADRRLSVRLSALVKMVQK